MQGLWEDPEVQDMTDQTDHNALCESCLFWHPERAHKPCSACRQPIGVDRVECAARIADKDTDTSVLHSATRI